MTPEEYANLLAEENQLKAEIPELEARLSKAKSEFERLSSAYQDPEIPLEHSNAAVERLEAHAAKIGEARDTILTAITRYQSTKAVEDAFGQFVKSFIRWLKKESTLIELNLHEEAKLALRKAKEEVEGADFGFDARTIALAKEIIAHRQAHLYSCLADTNLAIGEKSLPSDELQEYCAIAEELPTNFVNPADKPFHLSRALALRLHDAAWESKLLSEADMDTLDRLIALYEEFLAKSDLATDEVKRYAELTRIEAARHFNDLAKDIVSRRDKEAAKVLFARKRPWLEELLLNSTFRDSKEESDLTKNLLLESNSGMDAAEYKAVTNGLAAEASDESFEILAALLSAKDLEETKVNILLESVEKWPLGHKVRLVADAIRNDIPAVRVPTLYEAILNARPRRIDIVERADDLVLLSNKVPADQKIRFDAMLSGILNNPRAKRIATKSNSESVHALYPKKKFKEPIGKPAKSNEASFWSTSKRVLYALLLICLPVLLLAGGVAIAALQLLDVEIRFVAIALVTLLLIFLIAILIHVLKRFGRDERGAEVTRRVFIALSIIPFAASIVFLLMLKDIKGYDYWAYACAAGGWLMLLLPTMFLKERKNAWRFGVFFVALAAGLAALVFVAINLYQVSVA